MQQLIHVHGGETFDTYEEYLAWLNALDFDRSRMGRVTWKNGLAEALGPEYDVLMPSMPNALNARYEEWRIWFEKVLGIVDDGVMLTGLSLGGIFLAKYLATTKPIKRVKATLLIAAPYEGVPGEYSLADFALPADLSAIPEHAGALHLFFSTDDPVVPYSDAEKYEAALPGAILHTFDDRGHFSQQEFPELVETIRSLAFS